MCFHFLQSPLKTNPTSIESTYGRSIYRRTPGEALHPERESLELLGKIRKDVGEYVFESQYQQSPVPQGGMLIKTEWLKFYESSELPDRFTLTVQSWDTANKAGELNSYSVGTTWGVHRDHYYLLDVIRKKLNYPELKRAIIEQSRKYQALHISLSKTRPQALS